MWSAEHDGPGAMLTSVQPAADINDVAIYPGSGLIFAALETEKLGAYFIPALGPAPRWCHFIDGLTEEMEQAAVVVILYVARYVVSVLADTWLGAASMPAS